MQPIRETMIQNLAPKVLTSFTEVEKQDEVTTAYSENDTDEEVKTNPESSFKTSINKLKSNLRNSTKEIVSARSSLKDNCKDFFNLCLREKDLEVKIKEKNKEIVRIIGNNKEILSRCFDANLDLERLQAHDSASLAEQNKLMQNRLGDLKKKTKLHQIYLENVKLQIENSIKSQLEGDKILKSLIKQLQDIKDSDFYSRQKQQSEMYKLSINADVIKTQIEENNKITSNFNPSDKHLAKEISDYIRENMKNCKDARRELNIKLEETEELVNDKEQQISELAIEHEMKKSQKLHYLRKKKDEYARQQRKLREEIRITIAKDTEEMRVELKSKFNEARKIEFYVETQHIENCKARINVFFI